MFVFPKVKILVLSVVALIAATVTGYAQQDTTRVVPVVDSLAKAQLPDSLKAAQPVDSLAAAKTADSLATVIPVAVPVAAEGVAGTQKDAKGQTGKQQGTAGSQKDGQPQTDAKQQTDVKPQADVKSQQTGKAPEATGVQKDGQPQTDGKSQKDAKQQADGKTQKEGQKPEGKPEAGTQGTEGKAPAKDATEARQPAQQQINQQPDTVKTAKPAVDTTQATQPQIDTLATEQIDTIYIRTPEEIRDSLRLEAPAIGVNLAWAGIATPNLSAEFPVSENLSLGISAGLKPGPRYQFLYWPRWSPFDKDTDNPTKWSHFAVLPYIRWWPNEVFRGFFLEGDLMYAHYNIAAVKLPFGIYPNIADYRLQGDFYGAGLSIGCSVWLTRHINLVLAAGALGGYKNATKYECPWCGGEVGTEKGVTVAPRLDVSVAYHLFNQKRHEKQERKKAFR